MKGSRMAPPARSARCPPVSERLTVDQFAGARRRLPGERCGVTRLAPHGLPQWEASQQSTALRHTIRTMILGRPRNGQSDVPVPITGRDPGPCGKRTCAWTNHALDPPKDSSALVR
jgi:hypothetical protein